MKTKTKRKTATSNKKATKIKKAILKPTLTRLFDHLKEVRITEILN